MELQITEAKILEKEHYYNLFSSEKVCKYMDISPFKNLTDAESFLNFSIEQINKKRSRRYSIWLNTEFAGTITLYSIYWHQKRASIGYAINEKHWNKGIMSHVIKKLEAIANEEMGLNRIQATVLPENTGSKKVLLKNGFICEGILKQYEIWPEYGFVDLEMYSKIIKRK